MDRSEILQKLKQANSIEILQKRDGKFVPDLPHYAINRENGEVFLDDHYFFKDNDVYISKHNRFAPYPLHKHQFMELNYMYSGSCNQKVNGKNVHLYPGDILLLDAGSSHSIGKLNENDILINILFRNKEIKTTFLDSIHDCGDTLFNFLLSASLNDVQNPAYLLLNTKNQSSVFTIIDTILTEFIDEKPYSNLMIDALLPQLFISLVRDYQCAHPSNTQSNLQNQNPTIIKILKEIDENWISISLKQIAEKFNYNPYYVSNLIKLKTGQTFTQLVNTKKLVYAHLLITSTTLPISEIIYQSGFSNKSYFYGKYQKKYNHLPSESRDFVTHGQK